MTDIKEGIGLGEKGLDYAYQILMTVLSSNEPRDLWHWFGLALMLLLLSAITLVATLKAINKTIELLIKLADAYKSSGLPMLLSADGKYKVKRRKQFCNVIIRDLVQLSMAENWNDHNFTDLEAEVEIEGGYYASAWDRFKRKKSYGLRKEESLVRAIMSSTERALQLIGEPGSGKSVALRHLAIQIAEHGRKSNDKDAVVPLYINLREMEERYSSSISANDVRKFVIENIRRGDADTSSYVRENWEDYCNRGIWLFLFDSFDEIPAVLHSAIGSTVIKQHSEAIRQFLDGMGECKGILASREFKGPEALPWNKLRILPLSGERQDELIQNSLLPEGRLKLVRQHLASSHSSTGSTPLFLTLLCRYVRDENRAPNNDHDILLRHIDRLARREPEHLLIKYRFTVEELLQGAERLAQLFAENENLSLAPTLDQIKAHLPDNEVPTKSIERLVLALVDCKIGRADVPNAANGDRRFAFAHRRYQEALFVGYLARNPTVISPEDMLSEPRWREYAVTLLQICEASEIQGLLKTARRIIEDRARHQAPAWKSIPPLPASVTFYDWEREPAVPLLALLQEGLARRLQDIPAELSMAIETFLEPRWISGDVEDRCQVLRLGGLLPQSTLLNYLSTAFQSGTRAESAHAFRLAVFTPDLPSDIREQVMEALSDEVIQADTRVSQLSIEALAARLPEALGASFVVERSSKIRQRFQLISKGVSWLVNLMPKWVLERTRLLASDQSNAAKSRQLMRGVMPPVALTFFPLIFVGFLLFTTLLNLIKKSDMQGWVTLSSLLFVFTMLGSICFPYLHRTSGKRIGLLDFARLIFNAANLKNIMVVGKVFVGIILFTILTVPFGYLVEWVMRGIFRFTLVTARNYTYPNMMGIGFIALMSLLYGFGFVMLVKSFYLARKNKRRWSRGLTVAKQVGASDLEILYSASDLDELRFWLKSDDQLLSQQELLRGFSSLILDRLRHLGDGDTSNSLLDVGDLPVYFRGGKVTDYQLTSVLRVMEERFRRAT